MNQTQWQCLGWNHKHSFINSEQRKKWHLHGTSPLHLPSHSLDFHLMLNSLYQTWLFPFSKVRISCLPVLHWICSSLGQLVRPKKKNPVVNFSFGSILHLCVLFRVQGKRQPINFFNGWNTWLFSHCHLYSSFSKHHYFSSMPFKICADLQYYLRHGFEEIFFFSFVHVSNSLGSTVCPWGGSGPSREQFTG